MIYISITKLNNFIKKISITGHSIEGPKGYNIVCAAVSSLVNFLVIGLEEVSQVNLNLIADKEGKVEITFKDDISKNEKAFAIYSTFEKGLNWIDNKYKGNITLKYY